MIGVEWAAPPGVDLDATLAMACAVEVRVVIGFLNLQDAQSSLFLSETEARAHRQDTLSSWPVEVSQ